MPKYSKKQRDELVGVALQLAYDYENAGCEHVQDMLETYDKEPRWAGDLGTVMRWGQGCRKVKMGWEEAEEVLKLKVVSGL